MKAVYNALSVVLAAAAFAAMLPAATVAQTAEYPSRPVKILVGATPGGTTDTMARAIATEMSTALGQPVIVENKPGAGGNIAADTVAKSPSDGHTLLVSFTSHTINATLYPNLPFDPVADFTPITMIATVPSMLVGNANLRENTLQELIASAKSKPDKLTIALGGLGSSLHLAGEQLKMMSGIRLLNVPYKGTTPAMTDVLAGHVDLMFVSMVTGSAQVRAGKLKAFGVTSATRQPSFPDLPAIGEVVPGFEFDRMVRRFCPRQSAGSDRHEAQLGHRRFACWRQAEGTVEAGGCHAGRQQPCGILRVRSRRCPALGADRQAIRRDARRRLSRIGPVAYRGAVSDCPIRSNANGNTRRYGRFDRQVGR